MVIDSRRGAAAHKDNGLLTIALGLGMSGAGIVIQGEQTLPPPRQAFGSGCESGAKSELRVKARELVVKRFPTQCSLSLDT